MNDLISIAIISKNRPEVLIACIDDLLTKIPKDIHIIVVDSSDSGEQKKMLLNYFNTKTASENIFSFEHANLKMGSLPAQRNMCLKYCKTSHILFIDDDCFFRQNTFKNFFSFLYENKERNILGCRINQATAQKMSDINLPKMSLIKWSQGSFNIDSNEIIEVQHLQGTFMCFKLSNLKAIGGFNENLIAGYAPFEDTYTSLNMVKNYKQKPLLNFSISVDHSLEPRLQGGSRDLGLDPNNAYAYGRNGVITAKMHFGIVKVFFSIPFVLTYMILRIIRPILKTRKNSMMRLRSVAYFLYGVSVGFFYNNNSKKS